MAQGATSVGPSITQRVSPPQIVNPAPWSSEVHLDASGGVGGVITVTDRGKVQSTPVGGSHNMDGVSATFTPAAGSIVVVAIQMNAQVGGTFTPVLDYLNDSFGDTGGGSWAQAVVATRGTVTVNQYVEQVEVWWRKIGTSPGAGVVTARYNSGGGGGNGFATGDGWFWMHSEEMTGQHATAPIGVTGGFARVTGLTSQTLNLSATPATSSLIKTMLMCDDTAAVPGHLDTPPTGFTTVASDSPTPWNSSVVDANANGGITTTALVWTGLLTGASDTAAAVEIKAALVAGAGSAGTSTVTGDLTVTPAGVALASSSGGTSTVTSAVNVAVSVVAGSAGVATVIGDLTVTHPGGGPVALVGTTGGVSTVTAAVAVARGLVGRSDGQSSAVGSLPLAGLVRLRWYDPTSGAYTTIAAYPPTGTKTLTHPGLNSKGDTDWVLVADKQ